MALVSSSHFSATVLGKASLSKAMMAKTLLALGLSGALLLSAGCAQTALKAAEQPVEAEQKEDVAKKKPMRTRMASAEVKARAEALFKAAKSVQSTDYLPRLNRQQASNPGLASSQYQLQPNPYLMQKVQVKGQSVSLFLQARNAWQQQDYNAAEQVLVELTGQDHSLSGPWVMLGHIALKNDQHVTAVEYFQQALVINPQNVNAYTALAQVQRYLGHYQQSQQTLTAALQLWRDFPEAHYNLAILYDLYLNQPLNAQQHLEAYLFLQPQSTRKHILWFADIAERTGVRKSFVGAQLAESQYLQQAAALTQK